MAAELQSLLDRIKKEGVEKAETQAALVEKEARQKAERIISDAEAKAKTLVATADRHGEALAVRGRQALQQAARDVILSLRDSISATLAALVQQRVASAMDKEGVMKLLSQVVESYTKDAGGNTPIEVLVPAKLKEQVTAYFMAELSNAIRGGLEIKADNQIVTGFRVAFTGERIEHDFSDAAVSDALCRLLRPNLAEIVRSATGEQGA